MKQYTVQMGLSFETISWFVNVNKVVLFSWQRHSGPVLELEQHRQAHPVAARLPGAAGAAGQGQRGTAPLADRLRCQGGG